MSFVLWLASAVVLLFSAGLVSCWRPRRHRLLVPAIHPASSCSQAWGRVLGRPSWLWLWGTGAVPLHPGALVVVFFLVGARCHPSYPPCEQGLTAVGTGGGSVLSALWLSGGFRRVSVTWRVCGGGGVLTLQVSRYTGLPAPPCSSSLFVGHHPVIHPASRGSQRWVEGGRVRVAWGAGFGLVVLVVS